MGRAAVQAYARWFDVNLRDVDPLELEDGFTSFDEFFTRRLRSGARSIDPRATAVVSPCDGALREVASIEDGTEVTAKGHAFSLGELLADEALARELVGGTALTIYLHPRDYHRVHAPCDALVHRVVHVPGRLLPVTEASAVREPRLFALNERMIHVLETGYGKMAVVMVAAFGVGHMTCSYQRFTPHPRELQVRDCDPPARLSKGDELGVFHLGSTVILLTGPGLRCTETELPLPVRLGQSLLEEDTGTGGRRS
ncbi:MAG: phosphatidylserine decarboxylase [Myxococcales bacterium]|nr:phosphatidylserine decarboxylase [Myxococcales bacterium]MCB9712477.1 phosphatidylserine decarboxylase [Myxococcales bacterium]